MWRAARPRGMVFTSLAGWSQGRDSKEALEGRSTRDLASSGPDREWPPTPEEAGLHIVHFQPGTHPASKKETEQGRPQSQAAEMPSRGEGAGANTRPLWPCSPFFQARGRACRPHTRGLPPPAAAALAAAGLLAEGGAPAVLRKVRGLVTAPGSSGRVLLCGVSVGGWHCVFKADVCGKIFYLCRMRRELGQPWKLPLKQNRHSQYV